ncbi:MAG: tagatose 1,6-diphosphate aldolase [Chloroflexi bacterium]|nr:tagatose 1,6-diphosphate aldolase [Chloroflexota bacterium]
MAQTLTPGKWRGLRQASVKGDVFTILAFDQRSSYRKLLPAGSDFETAVTIKSEAVSTLSLYASAVLLDTEYGLLAALHLARSCGLLMALAKSSYSGDTTYRRVEFDPDWTVAKIKRMGAAAVKLLAYYHPHSGALAEEVEAVIRAVAAECQRCDLPLFLQPLSYSLVPHVAKESVEFARTRAEVVRETAARLSTTGADVLKLEFPVDVSYESDRSVWRKACASVSAASKLPWVLLSAGVDFGTFAEQTRIACQSGASGFLAGRAIWKEAIKMPADARQRFIGETCVQRLQTLSETAKTQARPWTDFYAPPPLSPQWMREYAAL